MEPAVSRKLDAFRFFAALAVVAAHASQLGYAGPGSGALVGYGRLGVVAFFVLSGYVIAYVCERKHESGSGYLVARLARLHSVLVPALLLTWACDAAGSLADPSLYSRFPSAWDLSTLPTALLFPTFLNQRFGQGIQWLSDGPLWSIAYEFWYYALFGAWYFARGKTRTVMLAVCLALAGPRILMLFPLWLAGVLVYRQRHVVAAIDGKWAAWAGCIGLGLLLLAASPPGWQATEGLRQAGDRWFGHSWSSFAPWDLSILVPICMVMVAATHPAAMNPGERLGRALQALAGGTFSIYCFHVPLMLLLRATGVYAASNLMQAMFATVLVVTACLLLSIPTERRKGAWTRFWTKMLHRKPGVIRHA